MVSLQYFLEIIKNGNQIFAFDFLEIHARLNQEAFIKCTDLLIHYCPSLLSLGYHLIDGDSRCQFGSPLKRAVESRMSYCVSVLLAAGAKSDKM